MPKNRRILLTGGESGGHIIPNLVVASAIKASDPKTEILYVASRKRLDAEILKTSGLKFKQIFSGKWRRYFSWRNFTDPFFILLGFFQSVGILIRFRPHVVFSKGGSATLPVVLAASMFRIRIILHESDSRMGLANRISARLADKVCVAFPELVKSSKYVLTGNPVRREILNGSAQEGYRLTGFGPQAQRPVILVWGGSQGAEQINGLLASQFSQFVEHFQVVHIAGKLTIFQPIDHPYYRVFEYVNEDLKHIYAITDMIIGRAGAGSLYETALLQKPNILIPLGNADQLKNADYFERAGASIVYKNSDNLFDLAWSLWNNENLKKSQKAALKKLGRPNAANEIANLILQIG